MKLETGKLDSDLLKRIVFDKITYRSDEVKVRPGIGEDCAVVGFGEYDCVMSTDPITAAVADIGRLSIHITCNDIASNGVEPLGIMLAVMLPVGTTSEDVEHIMGQAAETAAELSVEIIGGHTEITPAVNQPVIVSTAIGRAASGSSQGGQEMAPGDWIFMTKSAGLEGTGIIAADQGDRLREETDGEGRPLLSSAEIEEAQSYLDRVSVVREGVAAGRVGTHGMHDITEGGILGAVWEMCQIAGLGGEVWESSIPVEAVTRKICALYDINPLRMISSGSMVIIVSPEKKEEMEEVMRREGIALSPIGRIRPAEEGIRLIRKTKTCGAEGEGRISIAIDPPYADEIYKAVAKNPGKEQKEG